MSEYLELNEEPEQPVEEPVDEAPSEDAAHESTGEEAKGEEATEEGDKPKGKTGSQRQKERAERLRMELEQTRLELEQIKRQIAPPAPKTGNDQPPKLEDFDSLEAGLEAIADYRAQKRLEEYQYQQLEHQARQQNELWVQSWQSRMAEVTKDEDSVEAVHEFTYYAQQVERAAPAVANAVGNAIRESEIGPSLVVALGKAPDFMERLARMSPYRAVAELGMLERDILAAKKQEPNKPKTNAPRPPEPVRAVPSAKPKCGDGITLFR